MYSVEHSTLGSLAPLKLHTPAKASATDVAASAAADGGKQQSPHGRASSCSSPKTPAAAAQLRGLQRTPLPLILARMKVLLERLNMLRDEEACPLVNHLPTTAAATFSSCSKDLGVSSGSPTHMLRQGREPPAQAHGSTAHGWHHTSNTAALHDQAGTTVPGCSAPGLHQCPKGTAGSNKVTPHASTSNRSGAGKRPSAGRKPARALTEVSTSGGLSQSIMQASAQTILDELDVTLGFISDFLASLSPNTRKALALVVRLESYKKDQLIYDIGDDPSHFYVILSGRIDIWSHPPTSHRPKSLVGVLRRGEAFGDQAIINGERHSTAASPATNATLLVLTRQDFMHVLGAHFHGVALARQSFLATHVAPLADCHPGVVRQLCSTLVSDKPASGQECSMHDDKVCFIQAGAFELRLVDLAAQKAAEAALASAIASASSRLTIAPIPPHLRLGVTGHSTHIRRPSSAPAAAVHSPAAAAPPGRMTAPVPAAAAAAAAVDQSALGVSSASSATGSGAPGVAGGSDVATGLGLLQGDLAGLPTLGTEGVLASVRVKDGRLVGTQGLARQLKQQHSMRVPYKVVAELGPGSWFGGGAALYGTGPDQDALRVVAVGPGCEVLHAHLSGLEKHGGPDLIKRLRDDAAFKLTYYLGRLGVLPLGAALGHPEAALVAEAAAAAAAAGGERALGGSSCVPAWGVRCADRAGSAGSGCGVGAGHSTLSPGVSPGRSPCSTVRSRPVSGTRRANRAAGRPASAGLVRPARQAQHCDGASRKLLRAGSGDSSSSSCISDPEIGVLPPAAAAAELAARTAAGAVAAGTTCQDSNSASAMGWPGTGVSGACGAPAAAASVSSSMLFRTGRPRQKRPHVAGSGLFGPGVMAALQHVKVLQAAGTAPTAAAAIASAIPTTSRSSSTPAEPAAQPTACTVRATAPPSDGAQAPGACGAAGCGAAARSGQGPHHTVRPASAGAGGRHRPRLTAGTAADVYWQQPDHCSSATGAALSALLPSLFTDGLQPLVQELDVLLCCSSDTPEPTALQHTPSAAQHQQLQGIRPASPHTRPSTAAARLQGVGLAGEPGHQPPSGRDALQHRHSASLLAASVMWQRSSRAAFRPPLRQCLTADEIAQQLAAQ